MNLSSIFGILFALAVFVVSVMMSTDDYLFFLNLHAILIVLGGTAAAAFICYPAKEIISLLRVFVKRILGSNRRDYEGLIQEIAKLAEAFPQGYQKFADTIAQLEDPFLKDSAEILEWGEAEITEEQLRELLENRIETFYTRYMKSANIFKTVSKFPPAFGLLGTTLGMIALLQSLGPGSEGTIGKSMAIALVATMYGVATANFIFIPIAENLAEQTEEDHVSRRIVVEGVMMIYKGLPVQFVEENCRSFLLPSELNKKSAKAV